MVTDFKLSRTWPVLLALLYGVSIERDALNTFGWQNDVSWHVVNGLWMVTNHKIQLTNTLTWTAYGTYWNDPEWLWDYIVGAFYGFKGWPFVSLFGTGIFTAILGLLTHNFIKEKKTGAWEAIILIIFATAIAPFAEMRPQLASYLFFLFALQAIQTNSNKYLWLVTLTLPLWSNMHGSAVLWVCLLGLELFLNLKVWRKTQYLYLMIVSIVLLLLRPGGIALWFDYLFQQTYASNFNTIAEWMSPNFHLLPFLFPLLMLGIGWFVILPKATILRDKYWLAFGTVAGLVASRFLPYAVLIVMVLMPKYLSPRLPVSLPFPEKFNKSLPMIWTVLLVVYLGFNGQKSFAPPPENGAALYLSEHHAQNIVNRYDWGGTLEWYGLSPMADGRNIWMTYPWWKAYLDTSRGQMPMNDFLKQVAPNVDWVCWSPHTPIAWQMDQLTEWHRVYSDTKAVVWERVKHLPPSQ